MKHQRNIFIGIALLLSMLAVIVWRGGSIERQAESLVSQKADPAVDDTTNKKEIEEIEDIQQAENVESFASVQIGGVPFLVQAPGGAWTEPLFQNGCEEASLLMTEAWLKKTRQISVEVGRKQILALSKFEQTKFGHAWDTGVFDLAQIANDYWQVANFKAEKLTKQTQIIQQLAQGKLVLIPAFGQALKNPNFKQPGPITHMLVVTGYDADKKEFVTNDPGTKNGANYRYPETLLWEAIWDYPTGAEHPKVPHLPIKDKAMLVVTPN